MTVYFEQKGSIQKQMTSAIRCDMCLKMSAGASKTLRRLVLLESKSGRSLHLDRKFLSDKPLASSDNDVIV